MSCTTALQKELCHAVVQGCFASASSFLVKSGDGFLLSVSQVICGFGCGIFVLHSGFFVSFCWTGSWWNSVEDSPVGADSQHMLKSGWTSRVSIRGMSK